MEYSKIQEKGIALAQQYEKRPLQEKINIIAETFGCKTGSIKTSLCSGKWRGTSDISIELDNGKSLFVGNYRTPQAKTAKAQNECVKKALAQYHPEIVSELKALATATLLEREGKDNAIAEQKGLKPYTFLNVEMNDGSNQKGSDYLGWYYITLAVDDKVFGFIESGLSHNIERGTLSESISRPDYFVAGGMKEAEADFVFNNVGHSSFNRLYKIAMSDKARERGEAMLVERKQGQKASVLGQLSEKKGQTVEHKAALRNTKSDPQR